jgi:hypothetical protein
VAGIKADDEAGLLLDFLRHVGGRGVVDGDDVVIMKNIGLAS